MDTGPVIAQGAVPVLDQDTPETLGARVLEVEHAIYPQALRLVASGAYEIDGMRVRATDSTGNVPAPLIVPAG
jgi:phosphoribosylglycinamide formyltransferase-1